MTSNAPEEPAPGFGESAGVFVESGPMEWPAVVVHGGAGSYAKVSGAPALAQVLEGGLAAALTAAWAVLASGGSSLEAAVAAVRVLEEDGNFNAGRGAVPTTTGTFEMDAAVMDSSGRVGAVCGLTGFSAVATASTLALSPYDGAILLAGAGADRFAAGRGAPVLHPSEGLRSDLADPTPLSRGAPAAGSGAAPCAGSPASPHGTVGAVVVDAAGVFAAATSTGGRPGQPPGRVGDSPIPGAGTWADRSCAVSATGAGEAFILAGFARHLAAAHAGGSALSDCASSALAAVAAYGGDGGAISLGADRTFAAAYNTRAMARGWRHAGGQRVTILD